jgi:hypothetical protein
MASPSLDTGHNSGLRSLIAVLRAIIFDQASFCEPEPTPPAVRPEPLPHGHFGFQERAVARLWLAGEVGWGTILDNAPPFHHQHPIKCPGLAHVMSDAEQRSLSPPLAGAGKQLPTVLTVESAAGLIENDQPHPRAEHGPCKSHPLTFATRYQGTPLAEPSLQPVGQPLQDAAQMGLGDHLAKG